MTAVPAALCIDPNRLEIMMKTTVTTLLCALPLLDLHPGEDRLAFQPEEGLSLTKTITAQTTMEIMDLSIIADGQDVGEAMGDFTIEIRTDQEYEITDEYLGVADGRPTKLRRTFDELAQDTEVDIDLPMQADVQEMGTSSALEGETVVFTWDAEEEEYRASFEEGEDQPDEDLLDGLECDIDLLALLPDGAVEEGDRWEVEPLALAGVFWPGGNLRMMPDDTGEIDMEQFMEIFESVGEEVLDRMEDWLEGQARCTFAGTRDVGGTEVGVIELDIEVSMLADVADLLYDAIQAFLEIQEIPVEFELDVTQFEVDVELTGKGELLWDLNGGHWHSLEIDAEMDMTFELAIEAAVQGESHTAEIASDISGTMEYGFSAE